jgi:glycosyltransferase involved in cell wall biosynthesis
VSRHPARLASSDFAIIANGFADGPAQALRDYLAGMGARVCFVAHPLLPEDGRTHEVRTVAAGRAWTKKRRTPLRPPLSFALDPFVPIRMPRADVWFGFTPVACARGLVERRLGRTTRVVLWSVDFTPDRFGRGSPVTRLYDSLDGIACRRADARVELSEAARDARASRLGLAAGVTPVHVVPMGAWLERVPQVPDDGFSGRRAVFLGHLTARQGVELLVDALALLRARGSELVLDVVGGGERLPELKERARAAGVEDAVRFRGFVPDLRDVERLLAEASVAVAPYAPDGRTFTRYADPGKLKNYLAAGLPIVMTDVPPNARELAAEAGAELVAYEAAALADALEAALASPDRWRERRAAALAYVRRFDWPELLGGLMRDLGFEP